MALQRLNEENLFNSTARLEHVNALRSNLGLEAVPISQGPLLQPTAGIEIEMTWDQAFRDMQPRWLNSVDRPGDYDSSSLTFQEFDTHYTRNDRRLRPILQNITPVIPRVGFDSYWEFSFRPTDDPDVANAELSTLYEAGVLFEDIPYPTHMTIADIPSPRDAASILCLLEQAGGTTPERLESAITSKKGSWARKGEGGIRHRSKWELEGTAETAYEFRTLITTSPEQMDRLFRLGQEMAHTCLANPTAWVTTRDKVERSLTSAGLPLTAWGHPRGVPTVWKKYSEMLAGASQAN